MRRLIAVVLLSAIFVGCKSKPQNQIKEPTIDTTPEKLIGVWITYSEIGDMAEKDFQKAFDECIKKCIDLKINNIFVHVRPYCDAVYKSEYYPLSKYAKGYEGDALAYMVNAAHQNGIKIHAWINPYRVALNTTDVAALPDKSPAKVWLTDNDTANDKNVCITGDGIYLNPAESDVKKLILLGVREIIENYAVDGIHLDDYFYPTTSEEFDKLSYEEYLKTAQNPIGLDDWRRQNVNSLLHTLYCAIKSFNGDIAFGISPAADIDRCYNELYADCEGWAHGAYVDYIMPQLYFGFEYPKKEFNFDSLLPLWEALLEDTHANLYIGLANYKIGTDSPPDKEEWGSKTDIIARQIELVDKSSANGYVFFSYSSLFSQNKLNTEQLKNIKEKINE